MFCDQTLENSLNVIFYQSNIYLNKVRIPNFQSALQRLESLYLKKSVKYFIRCMRAIAVAHILMWISMYFKRDIKTGFSKSSHISLQLCRHVLWTACMVKKQLQGQSSQFDATNVHGTVIHQSSNYTKKN